jgi:uncharacterized membrane protein HdeD (DUF308 family)
MYIWGGILALAGIQQTVSIIVARRRGASTPYGLYILPSLIAITGVALLLKPIENPDYILIILGTATLLYGLNEMLLRYKFRSQFRSSVQEVKESEINEAQAL